MNFIHRRNSIYFLLLVVFVCAIGLCFVASGQGSGGNYIQLRTDADIKKLGERLELVLPTIMKDECVPGMAIGLIRNGQLAWGRGLGVTNVKSSHPVTTRTVFEAASLSKPVFSYAVLRMSERGDIDIDKPLYQYLGRDYIENDDRIRLITARMVMCHTSGFQVFGPRILFHPGEKFLYSTEAYLYLQRVTEHLTGLSLNELIDHEVFGPLGMSDSNYIWRDSYDEQIAVGHDWDGEPLKRRKWTKGCAAYTLYTTVEDYARFISAILNGTGLRQRTRNEMLSTQVKVPENRDNPDSKAHPLLSWGLGVGLQNTQKGTAFWHWGDNDAFKSYFIAYLDQKVGVLYFTNSQYGLSLLKSVLRETLADSHPTVQWLNYSQKYSRWSIVRAQRKFFRYLKKLYWRLERRL